VKLRVARDFDLLWAGESLSALGTQLSTLALPTLAILELRASALEVGVLAACSFGGYPVAGILGGPSIDRLPRRAVMLATDAVRAAVLLAVPLAALAGQLALWQLYAAGLVVSAATALFDTAYQAHLPSIVPAHRLLGANARLETSQNVAYFAGPGLAGVLIQAIGAVATIVGDALSYVWSFAMVALIHPDDRVGSLAPRRSVLGELRAGVALYGGYPYLPALGLCVAISNAGNLMVRTLFLLVAYRAFMLAPSVAGLILAGGGVMGIVGASMAGAISARLGIGRSLAIATFVEGAAWCVTPLGMIGEPALVLAIAAGASGFMTPVWNVNNVTLRQTLVRPDEQGRIVAVARAFGTAGIPIGTFAGGALAAALTPALGTAAGLITAMVAGSVIAAGSVVPLLVAGIPRIRHWSDLPPASGRRLSSGSAASE